MYIAYCDETGDDGYPAYSSPLFVLSTLYLHYLNWQPIFDTIHDFRRSLRQDFGFPVRMEMHTKPFLLNKNPYRALDFSEAIRTEIVGLFCRLIAALEVNIINVVIVKPRIQSLKYQVLDTALTYSIQRIENALNPASHPERKFLIITDPGRVGKMRKTARRIRRINFIPSKFSPRAYRREIQTLIEDPLPKDSSESYFIQLADTISFIVYLHALHVTGAGHLSNRLSAIISPAQIEQWMNMLTPSLNLRASSRDAYGIVYHPK